MEIKQIVLTEKCNLNCHYCYIDQKDNMMTQEVFLKHFETFNQDYTIDLFGGEPLLNWGLVKFITIQCLTSSKARCMGINLYSNGFLIDREIVDFIKEHNINFHWSYDGLWAEELIRNEEVDLIKKLTNRVSVQIGPPNLNISDNYTYFIEKLKMVPEFGIMRDKRWNDVDILAFRQEFRILCQRFISYLKDGKIFLPGIILITLKRLISGLQNKRSYDWCGAGGRHKCYMPNGEVFPCARFGTEGLTAEYVRSDECDDCEIDFFCDKGCYHQTVKNKGMLKEVCELNKIIVTCVIELNHLLKENGEWGKIVLSAKEEVECTK
jgi:uncharacterized protein